MVILIHSFDKPEIPFKNDLLPQVLQWLDWLKYIIVNSIARCANPGYFFISAVLLYKKEFTWAENIKKKFKTLLVPYIIFNTAWILIYYVAQNTAIIRPFFSQEENFISNWGIMQYANAYLGFVNGYPIAYQLWFIRDLMVLNLLSVVIKRLIDKFPKIILILLSIMIIFNIQTHLFFLDRYALVFFCLGYYFVKYSFKYNDVEKIKAPYIIIAYFTLIVLKCLTRNTFINYLPHFATIVVGLVFFYRFTTKVPGGKAHDALMYIAKYSFPIYLFHERSMNVLKKLLVRILPQTAFWQIGLYFGMPIIIICLCLLLSILLDKYVHKVYLILVGGRSR